MYQIHGETSQGGKLGWRMSNFLAARSTSPCTMHHFTYLASPGTPCTRHLFTTHICTVHFVYQVLLLWSIFFLPAWLYFNQNKICRPLHQGCKKVLFSREAGQISHHLYVILCTKRQIWLYSASFPSDTNIFQERASQIPLFFTIRWW